MVWQRGQVHVVAGSGVLRGGALSDDAGGARGGRPDAPRAGVRPARRRRIEQPRDRRAARDSVRTVDNHLQNAYRKLGVTRRNELPRVLTGGA